MNRRELQLLSQQRRRESKALLDSGHFAGSYYLLGYAVECAIKAAIAKKVKRHDFPDKDTVLSSYTHNYEKLLQIAGLWALLNSAMSTSTALRLNWAVAKDWKEHSRYELNISGTQARDFYSACTAKNGLLTWLRIYW